MRITLIIHDISQCSFCPTSLLNYSTILKIVRQEVKDEKYQVDCELLYEIYSTVIIMSLEI